MTIHLTAPTTATTTGRPMTAMTPPAPRSTLPTRSTGGRDRGEVELMGRFGRPDRVRRAWDELSEADRQVLLNAARMRRQQQAERDARLMDARAMRYDR